jgi:endonuclease YncB( thermonuclease family)
VKITAWVLLWLGLITGAQAETFVAKVIAVSDGDTLTALQGNRKTAIRLAGIDAPEKAQPWGSESRAALAKLVLRKEVRVITKAVDDYGRVVAVVELVEVGGAPGQTLVNVNEEQLRRGMAWADTYRHTDKALMALQTQAQHARLGLWNQANPQPPWAYRRGESHAPPPRPEAPQADRGCGNKRYCSQMVSCAEARYYLAQCGNKRLDKDGNGVPCENLCRRAQP